MEFEQDNLQIIDVSKQQMLDRWLQNNSSRVIKSIIECNIRI